MRGGRIGGQIFVMVVGLILALAVTGEIPGLDINAIGWIVFAAGVLWMILDLTLNRGRVPVETASPPPGTAPPPRSARFRRQ